MGLLCGMWSRNAAFLKEGDQLNRLPRRIAHQIADFVYEEFTGDTAYFDADRVCFWSGLAARGKRLAIMDQDRHNHRFRHQVLTLC